MRSIVYLVVLVAGMVVVILYLQHITRVPDEIRATLGDSVKTTQQIGGTIRARVGRDLEAQEKQINDAIKETEQ